MQTQSVLRQKKLLCIVLLVTVATVVLTACGTSSSGTGTGLISPTTPPTSIIAGYGAAHGCPSDVVQNAASAVPNVTVGPKQSNGIFNVRTGALIEIDMPFGVAWKGPTKSQGGLQLQLPYGYALKSSNTCIWRFVARNAGTVSLTFSGRAICQKVPLCVPSVAIVLFTFKVS